MGLGGNPVLRAFTEESNNEFGYVPFAIEPTEGGTRSEGII